MWQASLHFSTCNHSYAPHSLLYEARFHSKETLTKNSGAAVHAACFPKSIVTKTSDKRDCLRFGRGRAVLISCAVTSGTARSSLGRCINWRSFASKMTFRTNEAGLWSQHNTVAVLASEQFDNYLMTINYWDYISYRGLRNIIQRFF